MPSVTALDDAVAQIAPDVDAVLHDRPEIAGIDPDQQHGEHVSAKYAHGRENQGQDGHRHDAAEEARFHQLAAQLRCVQCQNQSLADSNAQIAQDLRREVLQLMQQGHDDAQIRAFLVARYGDFVLYRPPLQPGTWLLWGGPLLVLGAGGLVVLGIVRRRSRQVPPAAHTDRDGGDGW